MALGTKEAGEEEKMNSRTYKKAMCVNLTTAAKITK